MEQLADVELAHHRRGDLALQPDRRARPRPVPPGSGRRSSAQPGDEAAPGGGPIAAEAGERSGLVVVRNGRVVHHALDADLEAKGVQVCGIATCEPADDREPCSASCSDASPDAFTVLHDAFLAGGAFVKVPPVSSSTSRSWCCTGRRATAWPASRTRSWSRETAPRSRCSTASAPRDTHAGDAGHLVDAVVELIVGDDAHVRYLSVQEHGPHTWQIALQRAHVGRDASLRSSAVALGGDYARLRSESLLDGEGGESDLTAVYFGDGDQMLDFRTLQDHVAPDTRSDLLFKGAVEDTAQSVYSGLIRIRPDAQQVARRSRPTATSCSPRAPSASRSRTSRSRPTTCSARTRRTVGPIDDDQLYYLETRGVPPEEAERLIVLGFFDDVFDRLPLPSLVAPLRRSVIEKIEHRDAIARASA